MLRKLQGPLWRSTSNDIEWYSSIEVYDQNTFQSIDISSFSVSDCGTDS